MSVRHRRITRTLGANILLERGSHKMKIFICILSILQFVMGGGVPLWSSGPSAVEAHGHIGNDHGFGVGQQVIKVILIDGGISAYNSFSHGHRTSRSYSGGHSEVYKIQELEHGSSFGHHHGSSHSHATSSLNALLPQILNIILEGNAFGDEHGVNSQIISAYDHKGMASVTRTKGQPNHDLKGGHVIQKGTLEVTRTVHNTDFGGKLGGGRSW